MLKTDFHTLSKVIYPIMQQKYPIMLRGKHGIGKSEIVVQLAKYIGVSALIDKRASQMQEGDLLGLPKLFETDSKVETVWYPPDWYNKACESPCILFLDELDRASPEVRQGFFELADSRKSMENHYIQIHM
jgi:MoxR-like ATPase